MEINAGRWTADIDGDFVVFLIGARVQDPEQAGPAVGLLMAMVDMLGELVQDPAKGLLGFQQFGDVDGVIVQYWRSFEALEAYAGPALRGDLPEHAGHRPAEGWHGDHRDRGPRISPPAPRRLTLVFAR